MVSNLLHSYLKAGGVMQLATAREEQPWICTVYYVADEQRNLYWLSYPERRHSQEIADNEKVAVTIVIKTDKPVVGVQAEGSATKVTEHEVIADIMALYVAKYDAGKQFYENFMNGTNRHAMYKFTPKQYVLFDELNFPDDGRRIVD